MNREEVNREQQLRRDIEEIKAATAEVIAEAGDLLKECEPSPSNEMAKQEVIELLGVNYVGPEVFNKIFETNSSSGWFKDAIKNLNPFKGRVIAVPFEEPQLDFVKLKEILNEPDEWEPDKSKYETYALVFKPPISFLELRDRAHEAARAQGKTPVFPAAGDWYENEVFVKEAPTSGSWELVRRETVPGSTDKIFDDQKASISSMPTLSITTFPALAALFVGQYLEHGVKLYEDLHFGQTSTSAASSGPVRLGNVRNYGIIAMYDGSARVNVGLSVSRNLN